MAVVKPFRAVHFNPDRVGTLATVVSQPYDRIGSELQDAYYALSPYNIVRIIEGRREPGDTPEGPNVYTRARDTYETWRAEDVLVREERPVFYAYEQVFNVAGQTLSRLGLIAAVELVDFDQGVILPHERIHSGPKEDRLRLLQTIQANTEQIFILYPDAENRIRGLLRRVIDNREPDVDVVELWEDNVRQRVWRLADPAVVREIEQLMAPKRGLIIADGHHRYSTGLAYRDQQRAAHPDAPANAAFNYVQATLVSMEDPGLVILPTHREIHGFDRADPQAILDRAGAYFIVEPAPDLETTLARVNADPDGLTFGFYGGSSVGFHVLALKDASRLDELIPGEHSREWKRLAVSVLHELLLDRIAHVPARGIEDKTMIRYHRDPREAVGNVDHGDGNFVFFVSPTRMEQVEAVAGQGETMPQKSTDFYPKVISGLAILPVGADERL